MPALSRRAANLGKAVVRSVKAGCPTRSGPEVMAILAICRSNECGFYLAAKGACAHQDCGCRLRKKIKLATEHCPVGKWWGV